MQQKPLAEWLADVPECTETHETSNLPFSYAFTEYIKALEQMNSDHAEEMIEQVTKAMHKAEAQYARKDTGLAAVFHDMKEWQPSPAQIGYAFFMLSQQKRAKTHRAKVVCDVH